MANSTSNHPDSEMGQRIFLVGCPRSGTTLVQGCLGAHRDILPFTESHFFDKGFKQGLTGRLIGRGSIGTIAERFLAENEIGDDASRRADVAALASAPSVDAAAQGFIAILDRERDKRGCQAWIEKTPDHVWRIPLISRAAPDAMFIHVLRDPISTIKSLHEASKSWGAPKSWLYSFAHWRYSFACSAAYANQSQRHFLLFYEDFVRSPELWCRKLIAWLGLSADPELLARRVETTKRVISHNEGWKENALREIRPQSAIDVSSIPWAVRQLVSFTRCYSSLYRQAHAVSEPSPIAAASTCAEQAECS